MSFYNLFLWSEDKDRKTIYFDFSGQTFLDFLSLFSEDKILE